MPRRQHFGNARSKRNLSSRRWCSTSTSSCRSDLELSYHSWDLAYVSYFLRCSGHQLIEISNQLDFIVDVQPRRTDYTPPNDSLTSSLSSDYPPSFGDADCSKCCRLVWSFEEVGGSWRIPFCASILALKKSTGLSTEE